MGKRGTSKTLYPYRFAESIAKLNSAPHRISKIHPLKLKKRPSKERFHPIQFYKPTQLYKEKSIL
jgi:hypothetical protein